MQYSLTILMMAPGGKILRGRVSCLCSMLMLSLAVCTSPYLRIHVQDEDMAALPDHSLAVDEVVNSACGNLCAFHALPYTLSSAVCANSCPAKS